MALARPNAQDVDSATETYRGLGGGVGFGKPVVS